LEWGNAFDPDEPIGQGTHPAQNPPPLESDEVETLSFYNRNATRFVRDFGMMPSLLGGIGLAGVGMEVFLARMDVIHEAAVKAAELRRAKGD
jgi:hypothetical protein